MPTPFPLFGRMAAGIAFIGPEPELLELLGDKVAARHLAEKAGVRVVPGTEKAVQGIEAAKKAAKSIGFPLIAKASFGGGGRGMRIIRSAGELVWTSAIVSANSPVQPPVILLLCAESTLPYPAADLPSLFSDLRPQFRHYPRTQPPYWIHWPFRVRLY